MKVEDAFTKHMKEQYDFTPLWVGGEPKHPFEFDPDEEAPSIDEEWSMFRAGFDSGQEPPPAKRKDNVMSHQMPDKIYADVKGKLLVFSACPSYGYRHEYVPAARIATLTDQLQADPPPDDSSWKGLPEEGCLVQCTKGGGGYVGNAILWWKYNNQGYTTDPYKARVWPTDEAIQYTEGREDEYVAWPLSLVRKHVSACVDMQNFTKGERLAALQAAAKQADPPQSA